ncbi:MAG: sensor domain-containing protein, partial [Mycolicibacterium sp.]|nr:sensor domain-containing protein [Mycolicibacterium sp.]
LFPTPELAGAFFDASVAQWPACHEYTHTQSGSMWYPGEISNVDATLSVIATQKDAAAPGWACGRGLSLRNNIIVDVNTCSADPADSAPRIARLIADDVSSRW